MTEVQTISSRITPPTPRRLLHIRELDGLRGIAALMVFFHHVCYTSIDPTQWGSGVRLLRILTTYGYAGADVFFVLSGFLITSLLVEDRADPAFYRNFYWKRALRILPLYALCLLGVLLFIPGSKSYVLLSAFFLANFAHVFNITSTGPFWTLAIEEQFYLLWPTVVRKRSIPALRRWSLGFAITAIVLRLIAAAFGHHDYYFTFFHCDGLAFGAYLACSFEEGRLTLPRHTSRSLLGLTLAAAILFTLAHSLQNAVKPTLIAFAATCLLTGITLFSVAVVAYLIAHTGSRHLGFLRTGLFPFLGLISYALYMIHLYVLQAYDQLRGPLPAGDLIAYLIRFVAVATTTLALSLASRSLIERPAASLRRYVLKRPSLASDAHP